MERDRLMYPDGFDPSSSRRSLFAALLDARKRFGGGKPIVEDPERSPLTYDRLVLGAMVLGRKIAAETRHGEAVGVLLPNVNAAAVVLMALSAYGRVAAPLNFTAGVKNLRAALKAAEIEVVLTSRRFVETAGLDDVVAQLAQGAEGEPRPRIVYLEEMRQSISSLDKALGVVRGLFAGLVHSRHALGPDEAAVILFTSGSEGSPKGVVLTNANILANVRQSELHLGSPPLGSDQTLLNPLPVFHSYGLTAGLLLGLLTGMRVVLYPSPLHYRQIARITKETKATILVGTDTFLQAWMRAAEADDFASVKLVVAGAERLKDDTRAVWARWGTTLLEGYGVTECAPVLAVNTLEDNRPGTVGRLLPGIEYRLEPVEGIPEGGRLFVRGPNVMAGYVMPNAPGVLVPPPDGWHDTGDICTVDEDGFVAVKGRAKRFAKIAGEMVSLTVVEGLAQGLWPGGTHVAVTLPDPRKGEQIVLVTDKPEADREALLAHARAQGYPELWVPRAVLVVAAIPVLGSGKIDVPAVQELVRSQQSLL